MLKNMLSQRGIAISGKTTFIGTFKKIKHIFYFYRAIRFPICRVQDIKKKSFVFIDRVKPVVICLALPMTIF